MIKYSSRYSDTNLPDNRGRWARVATYKNITIGWISRIETEGEAVFSASCYFPTLQNDTANEHEICSSLDGAKSFINERWEWFLQTISNPQIESEL